MMSLILYREVGDGDDDEMCSPLQEFCLVFRFQDRKLQNLSNLFDEKLCKQKQSCDDCVVIAPTLFSSNESNHKRYRKKGISFPHLIIITTKQTNTAFTNFASPET